MGNCQSLKKAKLDQFVEVRSISDFKFNRELRHSTPFPELKSRMVSAEILRGYGFQKEVIMTVIVLNRGGRAFIISQ